MKISDFKGIFKKDKYKVLSVDNPYEDYYVVKLEAHKEWIPGEHGIFRIPDRNIEGKKWRAFSIASVPSEGYMMIGTRTGKQISSFKKALISLKQGDEISISGPFGWFKLQDKTSPLVLIASGVGITPIRALLKELEETMRSVTVIYASKDYHLFGDDIKGITDKNNNIKLIKTESRDMTQSDIEKLAKQYGNKAYYYISGAMPVIKSIKKNIKSLGVKGKRIINDPFLGY